MEIIAILGSNAGVHHDMTKGSLESLNESLGKGPDWFWLWVEWNQADAELLPAWFRVAGAEQLLLFWKTYFEEVLGALIPEYEGFFVREEGGFHLSEDDMLDFNNWVIVQGKALWTSVAKEAELREKAPESYEESRWLPLFQIYDSARGTAEEGKELPETSWNGVKWRPRDGFFPGDMADFIYEDRFGVTLWEQMK